MKAEKGFFLGIRGRRVIYILLLLLIPLIAFTQTQDDRAWFDPRDPGLKEPPLFYDDYENDLTPGETGALNITLIKEEETTASVLQGTLMILVKSTLYTEIDSELDIYTAQLLEEGFNYSLYTSSGGFHKAGVINLRNEIISFRISKGADFKGCLFIGKLPTAWFQYDGDYSRVYPGETESVQYVEFPCDLFFMDLDGTWEDNLYYLDKTSFPSSMPGQDSIFDTHAEANREPEIWVARITAEALGGSDSETIGRYLETKNQTYRNNYEVSDYGALYYEEDPVFGSDSEDALRTIYGLTSVQKITPEDRGDGVTRDDHFIDVINGTSYEWVHIGVRSCASHHHFGDKSRNDEIVDQSTAPKSCIGPKVMDFIGSSVNRYVEPNLGNEYLFSDSNSVLTVIGSTKSGGITEHSSYFFNEFYATNIGEAFLKWMEQIEIENPLIDDYRKKAYGMVIVGDPTIRLKALDGIEKNIQSGIDFLLSDGQQLSNGSWSNNGATTAFVALALLNSGYIYDSDLIGIPVEDALIRGNWAVTHAIEYIIGQITHGGSATFVDDAYGELPVGFLDQDGMQIYYTSSAILPIAAAARKSSIDADDKLYLLDALEELRNFLICTQHDDQSIFASLDHYLGGYGYGTYTARPDNSNNQFGIMGVRVANDTFRKEGDPRELDLWEDTFNKCVDNWLEYTRNPDGRHGYSNTGSYQSTMTAAALWTYAMCGYPSDSPEFKYDGYTITAADYERSDHATDALSMVEAFAGGTNSFYNSGCYGRSYYHTYTVAKALAMNRKEEITLPDTGTGAVSIDWYEKMCDFLFDGVDFSGNSIAGAPAGQNANGSWPSDYLESRHGSLSATGASELHTAWNINTLRIRKLPDKTNPNGPEDYSLTFSLHSYSDLHVYDVEGRHTGIRKIVRTVEEEEETVYVIDEEIPGSSYKIYEMNDVGNYIREASIDEFPNGIIPPTGFAQVVTIKNARPDTFRAEMQGTANGTYDLTCELRKGDEIIESKTYEDMNIVVDQKAHCFTKVVNIEGVEMFSEPIEASAAMQVDVEAIRKYMKPGTENNKISFIISETAGVNMEKVSVACTSIIGKNGVKINNIDDITFDNVPDDLMILENDSFEVIGNIDVPSNFQGPGNGIIKVASKNGGTKTITLKILTNEAPEANAGDDQLHYAGFADNYETTVTLDGSESRDIDNDELSFKWYYGSKTGNLLGEEAIIDVTLAYGVHTIFLSVDDGMEKSWDSVRIEIANRAPTAVAGEDFSVYAGAYGLAEANVPFDGTGSTDPEDDPLTYSWYNGATLVGEGPTPEIPLPVGTHTISLIVDDSINTSDPDDVEVTVLPQLEVSAMVFPSNLKMRTYWGRVYVTMFSDQFSAQDVDRSFSMTINTEKGSVKALYQRVWERYLYTGKKGHNDDKGTDKCYHCPPENMTRYTLINAVFDKDDLKEILPEKGSYVLNLAARMDNGQYLHGTAKVSINKKPVACAGNNSVVSVRGYRKDTAYVTLNGQKSYDPDWDRLTYAWYKGGEVISERSVTHVKLEPGVHTFTLKVFDGIEYSAPDKVVIVVTDAGKMFVKTDPYRITAETGDDIRIGAATVRTIDTSYGMDLIVEDAVIKISDVHIIKDAKRCHEYHKPWEKAYVIEGIVSKADLLAKVKEKGHVSVIAILKTEEGETVGGMGGLFIEKQ